MNHLNKLMFVLVIYGADLIAYSYMFGFFYSKSNSAFKSFPLINFFLAYSIPMVINAALEPYPTPHALFEYISYFCSPFVVLDKALATVNNDFKLSTPLHDHKVYLIIIFL